MILQPRLFVRDRPGRASPRKTKKAGDFPARKPGEPSVTNVTGASSSTYSNPGKLPKSKAIGPGPHTLCNPTIRDL